MVDYRKALKWLLSGVPRIATAALPDGKITFTQTGLLPSTQEYVQWLDKQHVEGGPLGPTYGYKWSWDGMEQLARLYIGPWGYSRHEVILCLTGRNPTAEFNFERGFEKDQSVYRLWHAVRFSVRDRKNKSRMIQAASDAHAIGLEVENGWVLIGSWDPKQRSFTESAQKIWERVFSIALIKHVVRQC